jgi:hypothetical protein
MTLLGLHAIVFLRLKDMLDALQGDSKFPEEHDLLKTVHFPPAIDPVAVAGDSSGGQELDFIIISQRPIADPG